MWRSWNTMKCWEITMTRSTNGWSFPETIFMGLQPPPWVWRHTSAVAIQHKQAYVPLKWRMASVGLTTFASQIVLWLPLLGMFTGFLNTGVVLILVASAWGILMVFNLITLPVEFDASARARLVLKQTGLIQTIEEETAVAKVLRAAAWTYVAAFITSLVYFLLHILPCSVVAESDPQAKSKIQLKSPPYL
jgi:Zn-dependent membrane protease YugP